MGLMRRINDRVAQSVGPMQFGVGSKGGAEAAVSTIKVAAAINPNPVVISLGTNATFQSVRRNAAVHALPAGVPENFAADAARLAALIRHLVIEAPAFDPAPLRVVTALISDELRGVQKSLSGAPRD